MKQIVLKNEIINNPPRLDPKPSNGAKSISYSIEKIGLTTIFHNHAFNSFKGFEISLKSDNGYLYFVHEADSKEEADEALRYITCQIKNGAVEELKEHDRTGHLWYIVNNECPY